MISIPIRSHNMEPGTLYIVATPIGNLQDITLRALDVLRGVDAVYAEDTRVSTKLLSRYEIKKPLLSYREAAETSTVNRTITAIIDRLRKGESLAYVSDAGTPGVSDPGNYLVEKVAAAGLLVVPIPGSSALSTVVSVAGFPVARPLFVGFLPKKKGHQTLMGKLGRALAEDIADAVIFYESPERITKLLAELEGWGMPLRGCLARELTKMHEEILRGSLAELSAELGSRKAIKGEFVLLITKESA